MFKKSIWKYIGKVLIGLSILFIFPILVALIYHESVLPFFIASFISLVLGLLLRATINYFKSRNNHVIMIIAFTLIGVGACSLLNMITINGNHLEFSNLLCCMMIGATYINFGSDEHIVERDFSLVERWTPSLFLLFFVLSCAHLVTAGK